MTATTEPIELETTSEPEDRNERLRVETGKLRTRKGLPVDKWFQLGGGVFLCVGLLAIVAGAYGVSHTARTWRQTPYVVSGGLLGLALVFIGGFAYFAFWLTKLVEQGNAQIAVLERIEMRLGGGFTQDADHTALIVVPPGVVHRADCPMVADVSEIQPYQAKRGLKTCPVCEPVL